jgi:PAS domain S-box-containing protein
MTTARSLRDKPIRAKLRAIVLIISGLAVAGSCTVFVAYQWFTSRNELAHRLGVMADIVGDQSTAALEFDQPTQAAIILRALKAERQILFAGIYSREGRLFASYVREGVDPIAIRAGPDPDGQTFDGGDLLVFHPMRSGGERIGTFGLRSDLADLRERLWINIGTAVLVLLGAGMAILYLSARLGGLVTEPVLRLAGAVQVITKQRDYSIRVERGGQDEMGHLIEGFNDMLSQIQARDAALASARDDLEKRVEERTRELQTEVAERRLAEKALQEKDIRLTEAQEIARMGSWEWVLSTSKISWSDEVYLIFGLLPQKFGGGLADFVNAAHPDDRVAFKEALETSCRNREPLTVDYRIIRPDGSVRYLHARGKAILDDSGRPVRVVGTLQDVTERKDADRAIQALNLELQGRMAELAAANKELEGFSYSVSHDLRAPLRSIDGYSRMLIEDYSDRVDGEGRRYLKVITDNTRKMGQLIDDLLAFSRMGRASLEASSIDMEGLARQVFSELREQHPDRTFELRLDPLPSGRGDPAMFRQVFINLISNAIKYSKGRNPAIIAIGSRVEPTETIYYVRDNGVGFEMQYAHKLFGVFQRLHSPQDFEGTGVGLALVQRIVQRHGGRVWAESKVGDGATFYFTQAPSKGANGGTPTGTRP